MQGLYFCLSCLFFIVFLSILNVDAVEVRGRLKLSNKWIELSGHKKISPLTLLQVDRTEAKKGGKGGSSRRRREAQDKQKKRAEQDGKRNEQKTKANQRAEQDTKVRQQQQEQGSTVSLKIPVTYKENEEDQAKKKELELQEREVRQAEKEDLQRELATKEKVKRLEREENTLISKSTLGESKKWCENRPKFDRMRYQVDCSSMLQVDVDSIKAAFQGGLFNEQNEKLRKVRESFGME